VCGREENCDVLCVGEKRNVIYCVWARREMQCIVCGREENCNVLCVGEKRNVMYCVWARREI
jgi:hypothetical protein